MVLVVAWDLGNSCGGTAVARLGAVVVLEMKYETTLKSVSFARSRWNVRVKQKNDSSPAKFYSEAILVVRESRN